MHKEKKVQIIKAAIKRFNRHGLNKTTLDEIARDLRIGKATLYHYFESKEELYIETIKYDGNNLLEKIELILNEPDKSLKEKVSNYFNLKMNAENDFKLIYNVFTAIIRGTATEDEVELFKSFIQTEEQIIKKAIAQNEKKAENIFSLYKVLVLQSWGSPVTSILNQFLVSPADWKEEIINKLVP